jgi:hypothetical protein
MSMVNKSLRGPVISRGCNEDYPRGAMAIGINGNTAASIANTASRFSSNMRQRA